MKKEENKSFIESWKTKSLFSKIITIIGCIISLIIIILVLVQLLNIWDKAINIFEPLLGVLMIIQAIENWDKDRKMAYISLVVALFVFIVTFIILF